MQLDFNQPIKAEVSALNIPVMPMGAMETSMVSIPDEVEWWKVIEGGKRKIMFNIDWWKFQSVLKIHIYKSQTAARITRK